jgi:epoxyqueuosine reductase
VDSGHATRIVLERCRALEFALAGVCDAAPSRWAEQYRSWLAAGRHGSMAYLSRNVGLRLNPALLLPGARSAIMVADLYAGRGEGGRAEDVEPGRGKVARYARGRDYHAVIKRRLHALCDALRAAFPGEGFRAFVDTAPVLERELAARAGLGWIARNTLLIHPRLGSYILLGGVLTTLDLATPEDQAPVPDHCGTCTRCIDACPTGAITPYSVDASRCISYLTIERRGPVDPAFHEAMGEWLYGCDVCQEVCPHNTARPEQHNSKATNGAKQPRDDYSPRRTSFDLLGVLGWTSGDRSRELSGSAMKRATLAMWKRNAILVLGNGLRRRPDPGVLERLRRVSQDESEPELVRRTARGAIARNPARPG